MAALCWRGAGRLTTLLLAGIGLSTACMWGTRPANFPPAKGPQGATVSIRVRGETRVVRGELYAVDSVGVTIAAPRLLLVHWDHLIAMEVERLDSAYDVWRGERVGDRKKHRLSLVSRFPQGLSGELLARVLQRLGQDTIEVRR